MSVQNCSVVRLTRNEWAEMFLWHNHLQFKMRCPKLQITWRCPAMTVYMDKLSRLYQYVDEQLVSRKTRVTERVNCGTLDSCIIRGLREGYHSYCVNRIILILTMRNFLFLAMMV